MKSLDSSDTRGRVQALLEGYCYTQIVCTSVNIGVLEGLADGARDIAELTRLTGCDADALERLIYALESLGIVAFRLSDSRVALTAAGEHLLPGADLYASSLLIQRLYYKAWGHLSHAIRSGQAGFPVVSGKNFWDYLRHDGYSAELLRSNMRSNSLTISAVAELFEDLPEDAQYVDVGGSDGTLLSAILRTKGAAATGVVFDSSIPVGAEQSAPGVRFVKGDMFTDPLPRGDVYVLKAVLHDWADPEALHILQNCVRVMSSMARLIVVEYVVPPKQASRSIRQSVLDLDMLLLVGGKSRTIGQIIGLAADAGLSVVSRKHEEARLAMIEFEAR